MHSKMAMSPNEAKEELDYEAMEMNERMPASSASMGLRYNKDKVPLHLVPPSAIIAMGEALAYGTKKYSERNWEKGMNMSIPYACLLRHLMAWQSGKDCDPESGLSHLKHVLINAAMLVEYESRPELDDRPKHLNSNKGVF